MRSESIDSVIDRFRQHYGPSPDWHNVAQDNSILYREDDRFVVPVAGKINKGRINNYQYFIGVPKNAGTSWEEFCRAHEVGHILLGHLDSPEYTEIKECEANYFARKIVGEETTMMLLEAFFHIAFQSLKCPRAVYNTLFRTPAEYRDYLAEILKS